MYLNPTGLGFLTVTSVARARLRWTLSLAMSTENCRFLTATESKVVIAFLGLKNARPIMRDNKHSATDTAATHRNMVVVLFVIAGGGVGGSA